MAFLSAVTLLVGSYDEGIDFYFGALGFDVLEDTKRSETKRWVRVAPPGVQTAMLLAQPKNEAEKRALGNQTGGRVGFFLEVENFETTYRRFVQKGVTFMEEPRYEPYGTVAVFRDPFGNLWDLIETKTGS